MEVLRRVKVELRNYSSQWEGELDAKRRQMIERISVCFLSHTTFAQYLNVSAVQTFCDYQVDFHQPDCLLRLWDTYFAAESPDDGILLHTYICLAILDNLQVILEVDCLALVMTAPGDNHRT
eukprot:766323-Hanusia_phi.AAC.1